MCVCGLCWVVSVLVDVRCWSWFLRLPCMIISARLPEMQLLGWNCFRRNFFHPVEVPDVAVAPHKPLLSWLEPFSPWALHATPPPPTKTLLTLHLSCHTFTPSHSCYTGTSMRPPPLPPRSLV